MIYLAILSLAACAPTFFDDATSPTPFSIEIVDAETGRGVPLVELKTVHNVRYFTDSGGLVAIDDRDLFDQRVFFHVKSHGYEYPADGFGIRGKTLDVVPGGSARLEVRRVNVAERLYRVTGGGIYEDTIRLGREAPTREPLLNGLVFGQDSVMTVVHGGQILWFWGDTSWPAYPLGQFHISGATSKLPTDGGLDPSVGVDLDYFVDEKGFSAKLCEMPGDGPTWIAAPVHLRDPDGRERLYAGYVKIRNMLEAYQHGFVVWDDETSRFEQVNIVPEGMPIFPNGHALVHAEEGGEEYVYFTTPYSYTRVLATPDAYTDPTRYEAYTPFRAGTVDYDESAVERDEAGKIHFAWKANTRPFSPEDQSKLLKAGVLRPEEAILALRDVETNKPVTGHAGTIAWNEHRQRWVMIFCEIFGTSMLGETWYAEADAPTGPWVHARKVVTHGQYSFYNPRHHPFFDQDGGRTIYFEGTYTHMFSGNPDQTPRYDYNQIMYRLDLDDERLNLPVGVSSNLQIVRGGGDIAFYALDQPARGTVAVYMVDDPKEGRQLSVASRPRPDADPVFNAYPTVAENLHQGMVPLHEFTRDGTDDRYYSTEVSVPGMKRSEQPVCMVWANPLDVNLSHPKG